MTLPAPLGEIALPEDTDRLLPASVWPPKPSTSVTIPAQVDVGPRPVGRPLESELAPIYAAELRDLVDFCKSIKSQLLRDRDYQSGWQPINGNDLQIPPYATYVIVHVDSGTDSFALKIGQPTFLLPEGPYTASLPCFKAVTLSSPSGAVAGAYVNFVANYESSRVEGIDI